jgi:hypothetical protein
MLKQKIKTVNNIAMRKRIRTKKNRRYRKKNRTFKIGGADANEGAIVEATAADEIKKKIEEEHSLSNLLPDFSLGDSKVTDKVVDLSEGVALKTIDGAADILGIDLNNSEKFNEKLEDIKNVLDDPENKELIKDIAGDVSEIGVVALQASKPFVDELITDVSDKLGVIGNEFGETGVKVALNTLEEIPGAGIIVGSIRSASNIGEALLASSNATAEIVTKASDTVNASLQNFDNLLKEKGDVLARTTESINKFSENMKNMPSTIPSSTLKKSGGSRKHKRFRKKTKKVRFNL